MENYSENCRCEKCAFKSLPVAVLKKKELKILSENSIHINFNAGENIIRQGAFTTNIAYQTVGLSKIYMRGPLKKDEIIKIAKSPSFIGIPSVFTDKIFHYSVTALTQSEVCFVDYQYFEKLLLNNGKFATELLKVLSSDLINQYYSCVNKTQKCLNAYIAEILLYLADSIFNSKEFKLPLTRNEFAQLVGSTRETVTRILHDFTEDGLISMEGKLFKILNVELLDKISRT
ncbi:MAG: Crp/Fnr family transcriptional regulator [Bacteroidales bacterium]|nr:Crp/Fnr family transcriptional regulator [Bacteroidales bacterium]